MGQRMPAPGKVGVTDRIFVDVAALSWGGPQRHLRRVARSLCCTKVAPA